MCDAFVIKKVVMLQNISIFFICSFEFLFLKESRFHIYIFNFDNNEFLEHQSCILELILKDHVTLKKCSFAIKGINYILKIY